MNTNQSHLLERFLRYSSIPSQSKEGVDIVPSSEGQWKLARLLETEIRELGLEDIHLSDNCVLTAHLKGNEDLPKIGWICHLDTVDISLSPEVKPLLVENYQGKDIQQKEGRKITLETNPELKKHIGKDILFSDGSSVLGADDKAAISIVMEALSILSKDKSIPHGDIYVAFTPDEEVGLKGAKALDLSLFPVDWAYTIDSQEKGEVIWETFNAGKATIKIEGVSAHPMSSKGVLVNPIIMAHDIISLLPSRERPEYTEGKEGFIWVKKIQGDSSKAELSILIRDHDGDKYKEKKEIITKAVETVQKNNPRGKISLHIEDTYSNLIASMTEENKVAVDNLRAALKANNIEEKPIAMRGGTDGSFISTKGIFVPNYFTGASNFHSTAEFWPLEDGEASFLVTLHLMTGGKY